MIKHIVIINFQKNPSRDYAAILERTKPILAQIPGILSYQIVPNSSKYVPEDVSSFGAEIIFKDQEALNVFMAHPKHYEANALFEKYYADPPFMVLTYEIQKT